MNKAIAKLNKYQIYLARLNAIGKKIPAEAGFEVI
jgi:hypothetical protein